MTTAPARTSDISARIPLTSNGQIDWTRVPPELRFNRDRLYRAFSGGALKVDDADAVFGVDNERFAPAVYGDYAAMSDIWFGALRVLSNLMASVPIRAWVGDPHGDHEPASPEHPVAAWLRKPNPHWSWKRLMRFYVMSKFTWGATYIVMERGMSGSGTPREGWWVRPDRMRVVPDPVDYVRKFIYEVNGQTMDFQPGEVVWIPNPNPIDEFSGLAPLAPARLGLDTAHAAMTSNHRIHANGSRISGLVSPANADDQLSQDDIDLIERQFGTLYRGAKNAHRLGVMPRAIKIDPLTLLPKDAEYINQLRWMIGVASRVTGVPIVMLGDYERATYSNMDAALLSAWTDGAIPELEFLADELTNKLLPMFPGGVDFLRFDLSNVGVLQENAKEIAEQAEIWARVGVPLNMLLQKHRPDLLPDDGDGYPWGDEPRLAPESSGQLEFDEDEGAEDIAEDADDAARDVLGLISQYRETRVRQVEFGSPEHKARSKRFNRQVERREKAFVSTVQDLFRRQQESVLGRLREPLRMEAPTEMRRAVEAIVDNPFDRDEWDRRFRQGTSDLFADMLFDSAAETLDEIGVATDFDMSDPLVKDWLDKRGQRFAQQVNETTWEALKETLAKGMDAGEGVDQLSERVKGVMKTASDSRARTIARTESVASSNAGSIEAAEQSGVVRTKVWLSSLDERTRDTHLSAHGQEVGLREDFHVGGATGQAPGDMSSAKESANCRCSVLFELDDGRLIVPPVMRMAE